MIPKVAGKGASFKGAGAYYLHDKEAETRERVTFTHTENLPTNDPDLAIRHMAYTAMHQDQIKALAGVKATGRKSAQSVYTYSLSWAPDETPTKEEMIEAGRETLKALGLEGHEALMVAHDDEPHPHLHVIVCRVNPKTGIMAPLNKDFLKLSRWAEEYERRQGQIRCDQRVENNEKRRQGQFVKYRDGDAATIHLWRKMRRERAFRVRQTEAANLSATQRGERQALQDEQRRMRKALYHEKEQRIAMVRKHLRERNRPEWAALFRRQREEWNALNKHQSSAYLRLRYFLKHRGHDPQAAAKTGMKEMTAEALRAVFGRDNPHGALSRKHQAERRALARETRQQSRAAMRHINNRFRKEIGYLDRDREQLRTQQLAQNRALAERHSKESQEQARAMKEGRDLEQSRTEIRQAVKDEFERRAWQNIREARQRREEERKRGRDRDGGRERDR